MKFRKICLVFRGYYLLFKSAGTRCPMLLQDLCDLPKVMCKLSRMGPEFQVGPLMTGLTFHSYYSDKL